MDNYEEKYKKALSWMQGLYKGLHGKTKEEAEEAFPELKNSENKNIPKALLSWFENCEHVYFAGVDTSDIIAWLKEQIEMPIGKDLQSEIDNLSKRYPEVSFAKLSRIAVHIANWQKQQIAKDNILLPFKEYDNLMDSINRRKKAGYEAGYKQGLVDSKDEHKPTDKIEPKFKVGDWVVYTGYLLKDSGKEIYVMQVASVEDDRYNFTDTSTLCFDSEKDMRSWTIQDAKDGDVLVASDDSIFLFKCTINCGCKHYVALTNDGVVKFNKGLKHYWETSTAVHPATKEQCDLLFQKMKEAGYEWDSESLELKKIEQKPAEWSEEDKEVINLLLELIYEQDKISPRIPSNEKRKMMLSWLKSLRPQNRWKPSKEQIIALRWVLNIIPYNKYKEEISGLLDQIKDLSYDT